VPSSRHRSGPVALSLAARVNTALGCRVGRPGSPVRNRPRGWPGIQDAPAPVRGRPWRPTRAVPCPHCRTLSLFCFFCPPHARFHTPGSRAGSVAGLRTTRENGNPPVRPGSRSPAHDRRTQPVTVRGLAGPSKKKLAALDPPRAISAQPRLFRAVDTGARRKSAPSARSTATSRNGQYGPPAPETPRPSRAQVLPWAHGPIVRAGFGADLRLRVQYRSAGHRTAPQGRPDRTPISRTGVFLRVTPVLNFNSATVCFEPSRLPPRTYKLPPNCLRALPTGGRGERDTMTPLSTPSGKADEVANDAQWRRLP